MRRPSTPPVARAGAIAYRAASWGQRAWDVITVIGCTGVAGLWYAYSGSADTEPDYKTSVAIVLLPIALLLLRRQIDQYALAHLQPLLGRVPALIRLGIGLALPFLVSNYLYAAGYSQFDYILRSVVISTLASYVVLRQPRLGGPGGFPGGRPLATALAIGAAIQTFRLAFPELAAFADDCLQDVTRAEDCLRTPGWAQGISTAVTTTVTVIVNGSNVAGAVLAGLSPGRGVTSDLVHDRPSDGEDGQDDDGEHVDYTLELRTEGRRETLRPDGDDSLWLYGQVRCSDPNVDAGGLTQSLVFSPGGPDAAWLRLSDEHMGPDGFKCVLVRAWPPSPGATPTPAGAQVSASTFADLTPIAGAVPLSLQQEAKLELLVDRTPADADGATIVTVSARLTIDGQPYQGRVEFVGVEVDEKLFENIDAQQGVRPPERVRLRCKFHLEDEAITALTARTAKVPCKVRPADPPYAERFANSPLEGRAEIQLSPSEIKFEPLDTTVLPDLAQSADELHYRVRFKATVRSASGTPVPGRTILVDRQSGGDGINPEYFRQRWSLKVGYTPPDQPPLRTWDPVEQSIGPIEVYDVGSDGDAQGQLLFWNDQTGRAEPGYEYDHWKAFFDTGQRYLKGQSCPVTATVTAEGRWFKSQDVFINPPCKIYVYVDRRAATGHAYAALIDEYGNDLRVGFAAYDNLYVAVGAEGGVIAGAVGGYVIGRLAATALLALVPGPGWVAAGLQVLSVTAAAAAGYGLGQQLALAVGKIQDEGTRKFDVCHGWDIRKSDHRRALEKVREWKRLSDSHDLVYDLAGDQRKGNCISFAQHLFVAAGVPTPGGWSPGNLAYTTPGSVGDVLQTLPRPEFDTSVANQRYEHPWVYRGVAGVRKSVDSPGTW